MKLLASHGQGANQVTVYETDKLFEEKGHFRVLQFADEAIQGAIDLQRLDRIVFEYPRALIHLIEENGLDGDGVEDLFIIGHGIGTLSNYFAHKNCITAEIDETVAELSRRYFYTDTQHVLIGDGRNLLAQQANSFDCIILDAFTSEGVPKHLCTQQFFKLAASKLKPYGSILVNITGRGKQDVKSGAIYQTMQEVFPYIQAFTLSEAAERDIRNNILIGSKAPINYRLRCMAGFKPYEPLTGYILYD